MSSAPPSATPTATPTPASGPAPDPLRTIRGRVQKGPFSTLQVRAQMLNPRGQVTRSIPASIQGDRYTVSVPNGALVLLEAFGRFVDELSGEPIDLQLPLAAWNNGAATQNINVLTQLIASTAQGLVAQGLTAAQAYAQARAQVLGQLGYANPDTLDLTQINAGDGLESPQLRLALLSAAVMSLPRGENRMPASWTDLQLRLAQGGESGEAIVGLFEGISAAALEQRLRNAGVSELPPLQINDEVWRCDAQCSFAAALPGLRLVDADVHEGRGRIPVTVRRSGDLSQAVEVLVLLEDIETTFGADYATRSVTLRLPAQVREATAYVDAVIDQQVEGPERLRARIASSSGGASVVRGEAILTLLDGAPTGAAGGSSTALSIARACLVALGSAAAAADANCLDPLPADLIYLDGQAQSARVALVLQSTCKSRLGCAERRRDWQIQLTLQRGAGGAGRQVTLGEFRYPGGAVRIDGQALGDDSPQVELGLDGAASRALIDAARAAGEELRIVATLLAQPQRSVVIALPGLQPLAPELRFGDRITDLVSRNGALEAGGGSCGPNEFRLRAAISAIDPALIGPDSPLNSVQGLTLEELPEALRREVDVCVTLSADTPPQATVSAGSVDAGFTFWRLPPGHGVRAAAGGVGFPLLLVPGGAAAGTLELFAEGLPLGFVLAGGTLGPQGLTLQYTQARHLNGAFVSDADPRRGRADSNDVLFAAGSSAGGTLRLRETGLDGNVSVAAGFGRSAYPRSDVVWGRFDLPLQNSALPAAISHDGSGVQIRQARACRAGICPEGGRETHVGSGSLLQDAAGRLHGTLAAVGAQQPGFGARGDGGRAVTRPVDLPDGAPLTFALAGYRFDAALPVAAQLPGHVQRQGASLQLHAAGSAAFRDGNHAPAGLSLGPEIYLGANRQPEVGGGQDLAGAGVLQLATLSAPLDGLTASKYVIRPSGLTGVFNVDPRGLDTPRLVYDYPVRFSRFAFRFVDNAVDPLTWIDGQLPLQGDYADFNAGGTPLSFAGMAMDCASEFGAARAVYEACDTRDNNGDGIVDENCPAPLAAFAMNSELQGLRFGGADGEPLAACSVAERGLLLNQLIAPLAIDKPLTAELAWTPAGELAGHQKFRGLDRYRFEADADQPGFGLQLQSVSLQVDDITRPEPLRYGRLRGRGQVGLPFWQPLEVDLRLENRLASALDGSLEAGPSVLTPRGVILPRDRTLPAPVDLQQLNVLLEAELTQSAQQASGLNDFRVDPARGHAPSLVHFARYEWGNTGLGFQLPVYYRSAVQGERALPSFLGVPRGFESLVLNVSAGINFIEPERTKFSFGASADLTAIDGLEFQIDLQSGMGLEKIDQLLISARLIDAPVVEPTFGGVRDRLRDFNQFANRGVDSLTQQALLRGIEVLGARAAEVSPAGEDPVVTLAGAMGAIRSLPEQLVGVLESEVEAPIDHTLDSGAESLRGQLRSFKAALVNAGQQGENRVPAAELQTSIDELARVLDAVEQRRAGVRQRLDGAQALLGQVEGRRRQVAAAVARIRGILEQTGGVVDGLCRSGAATGVELTGYLDALFTALDGARLTLTILEGSELLLPVIELAAQNPELSQAIRDGQQAIQRTAALVEEKLSAADEALRDRLCNADVGSLLATVELRLAQITAQVDDAGLLAQRLGDVQAALTTAQDIDAQIQTQLLDPARGAIAALEASLAQVANGQASAQLYADIEAELVQAINEALDDRPPLPNLPPLPTLQQLVDEAGTQASTDLADLLFQPLQGLVEARIANVQAAAETMLGNALPGALYEPEELRLFLVTQIMAAPPFAQLRTEVNDQLAELRYRLNELVNQVTDQANTAIRGALAQVNDRIGGALEKAQAEVKAIPLAAGGIDGYATIAGTELERLHIGAEWAMRPATDGQPGNTFGAALDAVSWSANDKTSGCNVDPNDSPLDVTISAFNLPAAFGTSQITMKKVYLGFTLDQNSFQGEGGLRPLGVFGGLSTQGEIAFTEFKIYDPAFAAGLGKYEVYVGAAAGAVFSTVSAEVAFLAGKTCNQEVLLELDPAVAQFIELPPSGFAGAYVRGAAGIPVWTMGCPLTIGVAADFGAWVLAGPPVTLGGLVGGGAFGKVGCVGALRGQIRALGQVNTDGDMVFVGEGFGVAGVGLCEPAGWTSVPRSRADGLCVTADALFQAGYVGSWQILDLGISAPH